MHDFKNNKIFINNFYENLKKQNKKHQIKIGNEIYDVCIDSRTNKIFEQSILNYINLKTKMILKNLYMSNRKKIRKICILGRYRLNKYRNYCKIAQFFKRKNTVYNYR